MSQLGQFILGIMMWVCFCVVIYFIFMKPLLEG